jgi:hypothetical protein
VDVRALGPLAWLAVQRVQRVAQSLLLLPQAQP